MDRNGYNKSLFNTEAGECYICHRGGDTARHEIIHGPNRKLAKYYGLWINVCPNCHAWIHREDNSTFYYLKEISQQLFEKHNPGVDFLATFGRKYI